MLWVLAIRLMVLSVNVLSMTISGCGSCNIWYGYHWLLTPTLWLSFMTSLQIFTPCSCHILEIWYNIMVISLNLWLANIYALFLLYLWHNLCFTYRILVVTSSDIGLDVSDPVLHIVWTLLWTLHSCHIPENPNIILWLFLRIYDY